MTRSKPISPRLVESDEVVNTAGLRVVEITGLEVRQWHPEPDGRGRPTQVHLVIYVRNSLPFVLRLKSAEVADALIEALVRERADVWPSQ